MKAINKVNGTSIALLVLGVFIITMFSNLIQAGDTEWFNTSYGYRMNVTISSSEFDADVSNYQQLIIIQDGTIDDAKTQDDGGDILFTNVSCGSPNAGQIAHDVEKWNETGNSSVWVYIDSASSTSDNIICMYYGDADSVDQEAVTDVWDTYFGAVYHMEETTSGIDDETSNNNDGTEAGTVIEDVDGVIGSGLQFDADGDYYSISDANSLDILADSDYTIEVWWKNTTLDSSRNIFAVIKNDASNAGEFDVRLDADNYNLEYVQYDGSDYDIDIRNTDVANYWDGNWHYVVVKRNDDDNITMWIDNTLAGYQEDGGTYTGAAPLGIGANIQNSAHNWLGYLDEVRISAENKSDAYIAANYRAVTQNPTYVTFGSEEAYSAGADTTPPTVYITNPLNSTAESSSTININVTVSEVADTCIYNLDSGTNYTLLNDSTTNWFIINQTAISNGSTVQLFMYCNDSAGNMQLNSSVWFTYEVHETLGTPYLIEYSLGNFTTFSEDGITHFTYGDCLNRYADNWFFATDAKDSGEDPEVVVMDDDGSQTTLRQISSKRRILYLDCRDMDNDGNKELVYGVSEETGAGSIYIEEYNSSKGLVSSMSQAAGASDDTHAKMRVYEDWNSDNYEDIFTLWCNGGDIGTMVTTNNSTLTWTKEADHSKSGENAVGVDCNGDGTTEFIYGVGFSSAGATTIEYRNGTLNASLDIEESSLLNSTTIYATSSLADRTCDLDGDGIDEFIIAFESYASDKWDIYAYEFASGECYVDNTFVIATQFDAGRLFYTGHCGDIEGDGQDEYVITYPNGADLYVTKFNSDASHVITQTDMGVMSGVVDNAAHVHFKPGVDTWGMFAAGVLPDGVTDGFAVILNMTRPEITPHYPNVTLGDNLQLEFTCFDTGINSTPITAYIDWYNDSTLESSTSIQVPNATETTTNISNANIAKDDVWYAVVTCDDGYTNSTSYNSTSVTVLGTPPDVDAPGIIITSPLNTSYDDQVNINVTTNESASTCLFALSAGSNTTMLNDSTTNWFSTNQSVMVNGTTYNLIVYCNDTAGNLAVNSSIWFTFDNSTPQAPTITIDVPDNTSYNFFEIGLQNETKNSDSDDSYIDFDGDAFDTFLNITLNFTYTNDSESIIFIELNNMSGGLDYDAPYGCGITDITSTYPSDTDDDIYNPLCNIDSSHAGSENRIDVYDLQLWRTLLNFYSVWDLQINVTDNTTIKARPGLNNLTIYINNTEGIASDTIFFTAYYFGQNLTGTTPDNDESWSLSQVPAGEELFNLTMQADYAYHNHSVNFTESGDLSNTTLFTLSYSPTILSVGKYETDVQVNVTVNASAPAGSYSGWINWSSENVTVSGSIFVEIGVANLAGDVNITATSWSANYEHGSVYNFNLNTSNEGDYNLAHCNWSYSNSIGSLASFSNSDFTVTNTTEVQTTVSLSGGTAGTDASAALTLKCSANAAGNEDSESVPGTVTVTLPQTQLSGGGSGSVDMYCGDGTCNEEETWEDCPQDCTQPVNETVAYNIQYEFIKPRFATNPVTDEPVFSYMHITILLMAVGVSGYIWKKRHKKGKDFAYLMIIASVAVALMIIIASVGQENFSIIVDSWLTQIQSRVGVQ